MRELLTLAGLEVEEHPERAAATAGRDGRKHEPWGVVRKHDKQQDGAEEHADPGEQHRVGGQTG